jgi:hypothetical protein
MDFAERHPFRSFHVFKKKLLALFGGAMALALLSAQPVLAQTASGAQASTPEASDNARGERASGRVERRQNDPRSRRRAPEPSPEENKTAAQALLTAAGITSCQVSEAARLGVTAEQYVTYETICASGPGYMVVGSTPPQTFNCLELAGQAETNRLRDPAADVGQQCTLPANQNALPVIAAFAREAGIDCTVDQGAAIGRLEGNLVFDIGCAEGDGFQIEQASAGWKKTPCWVRALDNATCRYTTPAENLKAWTSVLAGTEASACDVQQARKVGADAQGLRVYEVKCGAGDGYFARIGDTFTAQRVHTCVSAANIGGGCTLTTVTPPAATSEQ